MHYKDKATELYNKFFMAIPFVDEFYGEEKVYAKKCSIILIDEIIEENLQWNQLESWKERDDFWNEVKKEINLY